MSKISLGKFKEKCPISSLRNRDQLITGDILSLVTKKGLILHFALETFFKLVYLLF